MLPTLTRFTLSHKFAVAAVQFGETACSQTVLALMPTVQDRLSKLVQAPAFPALLK